MLKNHLEKLTHFTGSVKAGSIRSYAIQNRLSQSAISKCIQNLETELEVSLLERSRDGIHLTKPGEDLFHFAEEILARADQLDTRMKSYGRLRLSGSLTMGTYQSIAVYFVPRFFKFIRREQQELNLNLVSAPSKDLVQGLTAGRVDFILSIDPPKSKELHQVTLLDDAYSLYRQVGYREPLERSLIFTLPSACDAEGKNLACYLEEAKFDDRLSSCGDFESAKAMAIEGVGYALLPDRVAAPAVEAGRIEVVKKERKLFRIGPHHIVFSCRKHRAADEKIQWVLDQVGLMLRRSA